MRFEIIDRQFDEVIKSTYLTIVADYDFALVNLVPLIDRLDFQRNPLRASYYERLEKDIQNGCIMPALTIAMRDKGNVDLHKNNVTEQALLDNLSEAFVLDGIQRLSTLSRIDSHGEFDKTKAVYLNVLICDSMDRLLYRMIVLNNGQHPMTARHQIEILADNVFDFDQSPLLALTEKQLKSKNSKHSDGMSKDVLIKGYLAYISNSINIDNQKIIESKMDELIAEQIMESDLTNRNSEYADVLSFIEASLYIEALSEWFRVSNNFIGFSSAMSVAFEVIKNVPFHELEASLKLFESAFSSINVSKIKLGLSRRRMTKHFFENYDKLSVLSVNKLIDNISLEL